MCRNVTGVLTAGCVGMLMLATTARADINLELRAVGAQPAYEQGDMVRVGLYAVSDNDQDQDFGSLQAVFIWQPEALRLVGADEEGSHEFWFSGFLQGASGINESDPPQDGDAIYYGWQKPGNDGLGWATPQGTLLTTLVFKAVGSDESTQVQIIPFIDGEFREDTLILSFYNTHEVTGTLGSVDIQLGSGCGFVESQDLSYNPKWGEVLSVVHMSQDAEPGWFVTVQRVGSGTDWPEQTGQVDENLQASMQFDVDAGGFYLFVVRRVEDADGNILCEGAFDPAPLNTSRRKGPAYQLDRQP